MPAWLLALSCGAAGLGVCASARASEPCSELTPWARLATSGRNFAQPAPLALTALAVATPFGFAPTGLDQRLRLVAQRDLPGRPNLEPVSVWTPYVLAGGLLVGYGAGVASRSCSVQHALAPVIQAGLLSFGSVAMLKWGVGRRWPNGGGDPNAPDRLDHPAGAHDFAPFQRGLGAWPSGHTALLFAGAAAFRAANPDFGWAAWLGYPLALGVAGGMWLGDHHYASDIISGALFGEAIGDSVGQSFAAALGVRGAFVVVPDRETGFRVRWTAIW